MIIISKYPKLIPFFVLFCDNTKLVKHFNELQEKLVHTSKNSVEPAYMSEESEEFHYFVLIIVLNIFAKKINYLLWAPLDYQLRNQ